jgi:hypothetical protein
MEFDKVSVDKDNIPIVLIDVSGSTSSVIADPINMSVLKREIQLTEVIMKQNKIDNVYLMFWSSGLPIIKGLVSIENFYETFKHQKTVSMTDLYSALKNIPASWFKDKKVVDLHIFTDGEINSNQQKTGEIMKSVFDNNSDKNVRVYIYTVEPNKSNYYDSNCNAGNKLYKILQNQHMMNKVKAFVSYNAYHLTGFESLMNPDVPTGYVSFRQNIFKKEKLPQFIKYLDERISEGIEQNLLKLAHELSMTLYHLTKDKPIGMKFGIVNIFANLFKNTDLYKEIRGILLNEIDNHIEGKSNTYQDYRNNRNKLFERTQLLLYKNTKRAVTNDITDHYVSFPINTKTGPTVIKALTSNVTQPIRLGEKRYNNAGVKVDNHSIPMIPMSITHNEPVDQCMRQWARANYSNIHRLGPSGDLIMYYRSVWFTSCHIFFNTIIYEIQCLIYQ